MLHSQRFSHPMSFLVLSVSHCVVLLFVPITDDDENRDDLVAQAIFVRHFVEGVIERVAMGATELLGGMAFVQSPEVTYLLASARALAFHGPSRLSAASGLDKYLFGEPLQIS